MRVFLPARDLLLTDRVVRDNRVLIGGQEFPADLVALDMKDFDVVLDMDWLSRHRATLDCYKKEVKLNKLGKLEVKFRGLRRELSSSMISAMTAQRMLRKGCQGYLAYVVETGNEGLCWMRFQLLESSHMYSRMILQDYLQKEGWSSPLI